MKLQQLRYLDQVVRNGFNVSVAAKVLHTAQPGVSSQIQLLEEELNVQIFKRRGKRLIGLTPPGEAIYAAVERILREVRNVRQIGAEFANESLGSLAIATTHTQARYVLPPVIKAFRDRYPNVTLHLHQGNPHQVTEMAVTGIADLAIATEALTDNPGLVTLPCYQWNHCIVAPTGHPVFDERPLTLESLARYPIVTYDFSFTGRSHINQAFAARGLEPEVVLTAVDADVIKTYVSLGLGIGILATMAFEPERDAGLRATDASHLFEPSTTRIGIRRGMYLRRYLYAFMELFAPRLTREIVAQAMGE